MYAYIFGSYPQLDTKGYDLKYQYFLFQNKLFYVSLYYT